MLTAASEMARILGSLQVRVRHRARPGHLPNSRTVEPDLLWGGKQQ